MAFDENEADEDGTMALIDRCADAAGVYYFDWLCQALEENRQDVTQLHFSNWRIRRGRLLHGDLRLGEALTNNTVVQLLNVSADSLTLGGTALTPFIASSPSLSHVQIWEDDRHDVDPIWTTIVNATALLDAIASNGRIQTLRLSAPFHANSLVGCLRGLRNSLVKLELDATPHDAVLLATAINSLGNLKVLDLGCHYQDTPTFLAHLGGVLPRLQHFEIKVTVGQTNHPSDVFVRAVCNALDLAVELESFEFFMDTEQNGFEAPVLDHLLQILQQRAKFRSVGVGNRVEGEEITQVVNLLGPNYHLEDLRFTCGWLGVCNVFEALRANSTLTFLDVDVQFGEDYDLFWQGLERLGTLLPEINTLKKLRFESCSGYYREDIPKAFVRGFELNTSLVDVEIDVDFFDEETYEEYAAIQFFATRNKYSPRLEAASKAEMLTIFVEMLEECEETSVEQKEESGLSVVFETLRARDKWFDEVEP